MLLINTLRMDIGIVIIELTIFHDDDDDDDDDDSVDDIDELLLMTKNILY